MGFKIQSSPSQNYLYYFPISFLSLVLIFFLLISSSSAAKLHHQRSLLRHPDHRTTIHGGASSTTTPFFKKMEINQNKNKNKNKSEKKKKTKIAAGFKSNIGNNNNAFSVMLPKGFVPPSASSPCHNEIPQSSLAFYCHLSSANNP